MSKKCSGVTGNGKKCRLTCEYNTNFCRHHKNAIKVAKVIEPPEKDEILFCQNIYLPPEKIEDIYNSSDLESIKLLSSTCRYLYHFCVKYFEKNPRYLALEVPSLNHGEYATIYAGLDDKDGEKYNVKIFWNNHLFFTIGDSFYPYTDIVDHSLNISHILTEYPFYNQITNYNEFKSILFTRKKTITVVECSFKEKEEKMKHYVLNYEASIFAERITKTLTSDNLRTSKQNLYLGNVRVKLAHHIDLLLCIKEKLLPIHQHLKISLIDENTVYFTDYPQDNVL